ncbi:unnamed protein product, partial [Laminaria digitata]
GRPRGGGGGGAWAASVFGKKWGTASYIPIFLGIDCAGRNPEHCNFLENILGLEKMTGKNLLVGCLKKCPKRKKRSIIFIAVASKKGPHEFRSLFLPGTENLRVNSKE